MFFSAAFGPYTSMAFSNSASGENRISSISILLLSTFERSRTLLNNT